MILRCNFDCKKYSFVFLTLPQYCIFNCISWPVIVPGRMSEVQYLYNTFLDNTRGSGTPPSVGQTGGILSHDAVMEKGARGQPIATCTFCLYSAENLLIFLGWNVETTECLSTVRVWLPHLRPARTVQYVRETTVCSLGFEVTTPTTKLLLGTKSSVFTRL